MTIDVNEELVEAIQVKHASTRLDIYETLVAASGLGGRDSDELHYRQQYENTLKEFKYKSTLQSILGRHQQLLKQGEDRAYFEREHTLKQLLSDQRTYAKIKHIQSMTGAATPESLSCVSRLGDDARFSRSNYYINSMMSWNSLRLLLIRVKREASIFSKPAAKVLNRSSNVFSAIGCLYYLPRAARNVSCAVKHAFTNPVCGWDYVVRHGFTMMNDVVWFATGFITFGISTGLYLAPWASVLGPGGSLLTAGLYVFDTANAMIKYKQEMNRANRALAAIGGLLGGYQERRDTKKKELELIKEQIQAIMLELKPSGLSVDHMRALEEQLKTKQECKLSASKELETYNGAIAQLVTKQRDVQAFKAYKHTECRHRLVMTALFMGGMLFAALAGPVGLLVGSSLVVATCIAQQVSQRLLLPRAEVSHSANAALLMRSKCLSYIDEQLARLQKRLNKHGMMHGLIFKDDLKHQQRLMAKIKGLEASKRQFLTATDASGKDLNVALLTLINASAISRHGSREPTSLKALKKLLRPFADAKWSNTASSKHVDDIRTTLKTKLIDRCAYVAWLPMAKNYVFGTGGRAVKVVNEEKDCVELLMRKLSDFVVQEQVHLNGKLMAGTRYDQMRCRNKLEQLQLCEADLAKLELSDCYQTQSKLFGLVERVQAACMISRNVGAEPGSAYRFRELMRPFAEDKYAPTILQNAALKTQLSLSSRSANYWLRRGGQFALKTGEREFLDERSKRQVDRAVLRTGTGVFAI